MNFSNDRFSLRRVNRTDENLLFQWINDSEVRKWSFNKNSITLHEHKIWFKGKCNDMNVLMWIFEYDNSPAGMVRFEKNDNIVLLNYLIASKSRGKGLAREMLKMAINELKSFWGNIGVLAYTLPENIASIKSLEKVGFAFVKNSEKKNCYFLKISKVATTKERCK